LPKGKKDKKTNNDLQKTINLEIEKHEPFDTSNTRDDGSLSWLGTCTSIKRGGSIVGIKWICMRLSYCSSHVSHGLSFVVFTPLFCFLHIGVYYTSTVSGVPWSLHV